MQILSNYQTFPNKNLALNYGYLQHNNSSRYSVQNMNSDRNSRNAYQSKINKITFTALPKEMLLEKAEGILNRSIVFGPKEYKNLSSNDCTIMREYKTIFENADWIDINHMKYIAKLFSNGIRQKYPNGFTLVSIGRSPAFIAKYLEFQEENVKYCPISNLSSVRLRVTPDFVQEYKKYLDSIGLTADFVQTTKKPIVFTDFVYDGNTLRNFEELLALPEIGMNDKEKMKFHSIAKFLESNLRSTKSYDYLESMYKIYRRIFDEEPVKWRYSSVPVINSRNYKAGCSTEEKFKKYYQNNNRFEEDFNTKMMNFILAETAIKDAAII